MSYRFNPPPGWPTPPPGWTPPAGWQPDPSWPPAPAGWEFWLPAAASPTQQVPSQQGPTQHLPGTAAGAETGSAAPSYPSAPPPYSSDPSAHPFAQTSQSTPATQPTQPLGQRPAAYAPGGYAPGVPLTPGAAVPGGAGDPGGSGGNGEGGGNRGGLIAVIIAGIVVVALAVVAVVLLTRGGREEDPVAVETSAAPEATEQADPTDAETDPEPSDLPTTDPTDTATTETAEPTDAPEPTEAPAGEGPAGFQVVPVGSPFEAVDMAGELSGVVTLASIERNAECTGPLTVDPLGEFMLLTFEVQVPAEAQSSFSVSEFDLGYYGPEGQQDPNFNAIFCEVANALPIEIAPGETANGSLLVDVPLGTEWITYSPIFGITEHNAAWPLG